MSLGPPPSSEGSFNRPPGIQGARAVVLVLVALLLGWVLLHRSPTATLASGSRGTTAGSTTATTKKTTSTTKASGATATTAPAVTTPVKTPQEIKILVANGTGGQVSRLAGTVTAKLKNLGYDTLAPIDATTTVQASVIYYQTGFDREAVALTQALGLATTAAQALANPAPVANLQGANILVLAGPDLATSSTTGATTATTSAATHTTTTLHTTTTSPKP